MLVDDPLTGLRLSSCATTGSDRMASANVTDYVVESI